MNVVDDRYHRDFTTVSQVVWAGRTSTSTSSRSGMSASVSRPLGAIRRFSRSAPRHTWACERSHVPGDKARKCPSPPRSQGAPHACHLPVASLHRHHSG